MPSADQVPVKSTHSTMLWPMWVVLIAGSTGSALGAVRPPNRHITPVVRRDPFKPQARQAPCIAHSERDGSNLGRTPGQQGREPRALLVAVDFGIADHG